MNDVVQVISTVGFPIVCAGALFWYVVRVQDQMRTTVDNNTKVLHQIFTVLDTLTEKPLEDKSDV